MRLRAAILLLAAGCSSRSVPEDDWSPYAVLLCQRADCGACGGNRGVTCRTCHGKGETRCDSCDGTGKVRCTKCGGDGRHEGAECESCRGNGRTSCSSCGGDGEETCSTCDGKGKTACLQPLLVADQPALLPGDAWPPGNYRGAKK